MEALTQNLKSESVPLPEDITCPQCGRAVEPVFMEATQFTKAKWLRGDCNYCRAETERKRREVEFRERQKKIEEQIKAANIEKRFVDVTFENYSVNPNNQQQAKNFRTLRDFVDDFEHHLDAGTWLLLLGSYGVGKTHLATAVIKSLITKGHTAILVKLNGLFDTVKQTYAGGSALTDKELIKKVIGIDCLVLDEIDVQRNSKTDRLITFEILNGRYEKMKPTILIGNCKIDEIEDIFDGAIVDRIYEVGKILLFNWDSYRREQRFKLNKAAEV
ncbi:MAG: ATP-binding protein [Candidatus Omnitrophica bacterium]|nr:ATP-binding protein [Candidatus Omnitrophota bacterium]